MEITLWLYGCSWAILLLILLFSICFQKQKIKDAFDGSPWLYVLFLLFSPLVVLLIPYILISNRIKKRKCKKMNEERNLMEKKKEEEINLAKIRYTKAVSHSNNLFVPQLGYFAYSIFVDMHKGYYSDVIDSFCIKTINNTKLGIELCKQDDFGDTSKLYIKLLNGEQDYDIFKHILVESSAEAAWKVYLLHSLWHILPLWWHANYSHRKFILHKIDLIYLSNYRQEPLDLLSEIDVNIEPTIHKYQDYFYVSCCYWSDWGGLIREYIEITVKDDKVVNIVTFDQEVIYKYDCGIYL